MKSYYYFVRDVGHMSPDSIIYHVAVGNSRRERMMFQCVCEFCQDCGFYFQPVSVQSDTAIRNLEKCLIPGISLHLSPFRRASITIVKLFELIESDSFGAFEDDFCENHTSFLLHSLLLPKIVKDNKTTIKIKSTANPTRKNLKSENAADFDSFLFGSLLIAIIFIIAGYFEGNYGYVY